MIRKGSPLRKTVATETVDLLKASKSGELSVLAPVKVRIGFT